MIKLHDFKANRLSLNWETILIGLEGPGKFPAQIMPKDVVAYAIDLILQDDNQSDNIWVLAGLNEIDKSEIKKLVQELANSEKIVREVELDKWKVMILGKVLNELSNEPIYDLIKLTEFWERFDFPADNPHVVQGVGNNISPEDYYTKENYDIIINSHKKWIERKLTQVRGI